jgi:hypothetical protein
MIDTPLGRTEIKLINVFPHDISIEDLRRESNPSPTVEIFARLCRLLPTTLVVILDQAEELLTLNQPGDEERRNIVGFFRFLREIGDHPLPIKMLITLRTEFTVRL